MTDSDSAWSHGARHLNDILAAKCRESCSPTELNGVSKEHVVRPLADPAPVCSHARGPTGNLMVDSCSRSLRTGSLDSHSCAPANPIKRKRLRRGIFDRKAAKSVASSADRLSRSIGGRIEATVGASLFKERWVRVSF